MAQCLEGGGGVESEGLRDIVRSRVSQRFMEPNLNHCAIEIEKRIHPPSIPNYWGIDLKIDISRDSSSIRARVLLSINKI